MPRRKNYNLPGHGHELTFTCYRRYPFLSKPRTCRWLAEAVNQTCEKLRVRLLAYVFMPEHVHLIVWPTEAEYDVADFRKRVKEPVGRKAIAHLKEHAPQWLDRVTRQRGKRTQRLFWQSGGGYDRNITCPQTLWSMIDYLHQNPVRRELVERAEDWEWSSAWWYLRGEPGPCVVSKVEV